MATTSCESILHLVIISHGLHGTPGRIAPIVQSIKKHVDERTTLVHAAEANAGVLSSLVSTTRGVKYGGELLADEIRGLVRAHASIRYISLCGLSLGGLYIRAAAPVIEELGLIPVNFITLASPHLGVRNHLASAVELAMKWGVIGQTGYDLLLSDTTGQAGMPILCWMAHESSPYYAALGRFRNRVLLANLVGDDKVPHWSAALVSSTTLLTALAGKEPTELRCCSTTACGGTAAPALCTIGLVDIPHEVDHRHANIPLEHFSHISAIYAQKRKPSSAVLSLESRIHLDGPLVSHSNGVGTVQTESVHYFERAGSADPLGGTSLEASMADSLRRLGGWINVDVLFEEFGGPFLNHFRIGGAEPPKWLSYIVAGPSAGSDVLDFVGKHLFLDPGPIPVNITT
jgi:hypothetical protein